MPRMAQILRRVVQFIDLSASDKKILILAMLALPNIAVLLHTVGYINTKFLLSRLIPTQTSLRNPHGNEMLVVHNLARIIHIAARHNIYNANCLKQSLLLWFLLGRRLISSEIKIGVEKKANSRFNAHAWVECNGEPLIDSKDTINRFSAF